MAKHFHQHAFLPFVHVDTGHNFSETIDYRDQFVENLGVELIVGSVQDSINRGTAVEETGPNASRNALQSVTLLRLENEKLDACLGGGRRDEERLGKGAIFSLSRCIRAMGSENQRPELWNLFNGRKNREKTGVFPLRVD